jgi:hypothetical protein
MAKRIIQEHHISYDPSFSVLVYKGEHHILSKMQWFCRKKVSRGFITALKVFIAEHEHTAKQLESEKT